MKMTKTLFCLCLLLSVGMALQPLWGQRRGNGNVIRETRDLSNFTGVNVSGAFEVVLKPGPFDVVVEADENLMQVIRTEVKNGQLHIYTDGLSIKKARKLNLYVSLPELRDLDVSGAAEVSGKEAFATQLLRIEMSGAAELALNVAVDELHFKSSGAAETDLQGMATKALISLSGASELQANALENQLMEVHQSGASSAEVHCEADIQASVSGASSLRCNGKPTSHRIDRSGAASVRLL